MKKENWVWMPHAGHFIAGNQCQFHLAAYVGKYIVSTVGELDWHNKEIQEIHAKIHDLPWYEKNKSLKGDYWHAEYMKRFGYEELGYDRTYETMVFKAKKADKYLCCPYTMESGADIDMRGYKTAEDAYKGHLDMCKKWSKK